MSNHSGSYMLNEILRTPELQTVFQDIGIEKTQSLILKILQISNDYDCNSGEILDKIGERFGICYCCKQKANKFIDAVCQSCYDTYFEPIYANNTEVEELISIVLKINDSKLINQNLKQNFIDLGFFIKETEIFIYDYKFSSTILKSSEQNGKWIVHFNRLLIQKYNAIVSALTN